MSRVQLNARFVRWGSLVLAILTLTACQQRMAHSPQYRPLDETEFFPDHRSARPLEEGVVHRSQILDDDVLASGLSAEGKQIQTVKIFNEDGTDKEMKTGPGIPNKKSNFVSEFPFQLTAADLQRGKERYQVFCVPCHSPVGDGKGKIVERGFLPPPNFHTDNSRGFAFYRDPETNANFRIPLREVPAGYIFEVITKGYGAMPEYAAQIPIADRWRIAAYVKALQLSQNKTETERALGGKK